MAFKIMKLLTHVLLPLPLFSFLAFSAFRLILRQSFVENGLQNHLSAECHPNLYLLQYTGNPQIDEFVCAMVVFFHALMDPTYYPLNAVLFPAIGIITLITLIEAVRDHRPLVLGAPTAIGLLFQLCSMGVIIPIYALLFVVTGTVSIRPSHTPNPPSKIDPSNAECLLFGFLLGYAFPTALMLYSVDPSLTALWQGFPFLVALAAFAYRLLPSSLPDIHSGHSAIMAALTLTFVLSALLHVLYVWPLFLDVEALRMLFVPINIANATNPATVSLSDGVHEFIKWDIIFAMGSMMLATLWMADSVLNFIGIIVWYGVATIAFGPAVAIAGVFMWRERRLNEQSHALLQKMGSRKTE